MAQETTPEQSAAEQSAEIYAKGYDKFRFGGYGEALANFMDYGINRYTRPEGNEKTHVTPFLFLALSWLSIISSIPNGY